MQIKYQIYYKKTWLLEINKELNDSQGNDIIWINWTTWQDDNQISVTLNAQSPGEYFYTIEFFDAHNQLGLADTVLVKVELPNSPETPNSPQSIPGFELFYLIGVVFFMIFLVAIKNRK